MYKWNRTIVLQSELDVTLERHTKTVFTKLRQSRRGKLIKTTLLDSGENYLLRTVNQHGPPGRNERLEDLFAHVDINHATVTTSQLAVLALHRT